MKKLITSEVARELGRRGGLKRAANRKAKAGLPPKQTRHAACLFSCPQCGHEFKVEVASL